MKLRDVAVELFLLPQVPVQRGERLMHELHDANASGQQQHLEVRACAAVERQWDRDDGSVKVMAACAAVILEKPEDMTDYIARRTTHAIDDQRLAPAKKRFGRADDVADDSEGL